MHDRFRLIMARLQQAPDLQRWWVPFTQTAAIPCCTPHPSTGLSTRVVSLHSQNTLWCSVGQHCKPSVRIQTPLPCGYDVYRCGNDMSRCDDVDLEGVMCLDGNS